MSLASDIEFSSAAPDDWEANPESSLKTDGRFQVWLRYPEFGGLPTWEPVVTCRTAVEALRECSRGFGTIRGLLMAAGYSTDDAYARVLVFDRVTGLRVLWWDSHIRALHAEPGFLDGPLPLDGL